MNWTTADDLRAQVQKRWDKGELLAQLVPTPPAAEPVPSLFPLRLRLQGPTSVSYTHLDVYKRQCLKCAASSRPLLMPSGWPRLMSGWRLIKPNSRARTTLAQRWTRPFKGYEAL